MPSQKCGCEKDCQAVFEAAAIELKAGIPID
jgi:hypothetical protein